MSTKPCVFCGTPTPQVEGRKPRKYCSDTCRQKDWQANKKKIIQEVEKSTPVIVLKIKQKEKKSPPLTPKNNKRPDNWNSLSRSEQMKWIKNNQ